MRQLRLMRDPQSDTLRPDDTLCPVHDIDLLQANWDGEYGPVNAWLHHHPTGARCRFEVEVRLYVKLLQGGCLL
jgi:hypothetical protein